MFGEKGSQREVVLFAFAAELIHIMDRIMEIFENFVVCPAALSLSLQQFGGKISDLRDVSDHLEQPFAHEIAEEFLSGTAMEMVDRAKDLIPRVLKLQYAKYHYPLRGQRRNRLLRCEAGAYSYTSTTCGRYHRVLPWFLT